MVAVVWLSDYYLYSLTVCSEDKRVFLAATSICYLLFSLGLLFGKHTQEYYMTLYIKWALSCLERILKGFNLCFISENSLEYIDVTIIQI